MHRWPTRRWTVPEQFTNSDPPSSSAEAVRPGWWRLRLRSHAGRGRHGHAELAAEPGSAGLPAPEAGENVERQHNAQEDDDDEGPRPARRYLGPAGEWYIGSGLAGLQTGRPSEAQGPDDDDRRRLARARPFVQRLASDDPNPNGRRDAKETFTSLALDTETH